MKKFMKNVFHCTNKFARWEITRDQPLLFKKSPKNKQVSTHSIYKMSVRIAWMCNGIDQQLHGTCSYCRSQKNNSDNQRLNLRRWRLFIGWIICGGVEGEMIVWGANQLKLLTMPCLLWDCVIEKKEILYFLNKQSFFF